MFLVLGLVKLCIRYCLLFSIQEKNNYGVKDRRGKKKWEENAEYSESEPKII